MRFQSSLVFPRCLRLWCGATSRAIQFQWFSCSLSTHTDSLFNHKFTHFVTVLCDEWVESQTLKTMGVETALTGEMNTDLRENKRTFPQSALWGQKDTGAGALLEAPGIATRNKKLLGAPGLTTRSKDATRNKEFKHVRHDKPNTFFTKALDKPLLPTGMSCGCRLSPCCIKFDFCSSFRVKTHTASWSWGILDLILLPSSSCCFLAEHFLSPLSLWSQCVCPPPLCTHAPTARQALLTHPGQPGKGLFCVAATATTIQWLLFALGLTTGTHLPNMCCEQDVIWSKLFSLQFLFSTSTPFVLQIQTKEVRPCNIVQLKPGL